MLMCLEINSSPTIRWPSCQVVKFPKIAIDHVLIPRLDQFVTASIQTT